MLFDNSSKKELFELVKSFEKVYVVASLDGGVGSRATSVIVDYLNNLLGKEIVVVAILPFSFEGKTRGDTAQAALKEIQTINKDVIVIENERVMQKYESEKLGTKETFQYISKNIYQNIINAIQT